MLTTLIACCLLTQAQAPDLPKETKVEYEKFVDATNVNLLLWEKVRDDHGESLVIDAFHKGRRTKAMEEVRLHLSRIGPRLQCIDTHRVFIACGDDRVPIRDVERKYRQAPGDEDYWLEFFHITISAAELQKALARGKDLEIKIGVHDPFPIGAETRAKMLKFTKAVRSGAY